MTATTLRDFSSWISEKITPSPGQFGNSRARPTKLTLEERPDDVRLVPEVERLIRGLEDDILLELGPAHVAKVDGIDIKLDRRILLDAQDCVVHEGGASGSKSDGVF